MPSLPCTVSDAMMLPSVSGDMLVDVVVEANRRYWEYERSHVVKSERFDEPETISVSSDSSNSTMSISDVFEGSAALVFEEHVAGPSNISPKVRACTGVGCWAKGSRGCREHQKSTKTRPFCSEVSGGMIWDVGRGEAGAVGNTKTKLFATGIVSSKEGVVSSTAGVVSSTAEFVFSMAGIISKAGVISSMAGGVSSKSGIVSSMAGIVSSKAGVVSSKAGIIASTRSAWFVSKKPNPITPSVLHERIWRWHISTKSIPVKTLNLLLESLRQAYFCRHLNVDCYYLSQSYKYIPKHNLCNNANILIIFQMDNLNPQHIFNDHIMADMSVAKFKDIYVYYWKESYSDTNMEKYREFVKNANANNCSSDKHHPKLYLLGSIISGLHKDEGGDRSSPIYWNKPNDLVNILKLPIASKQSRKNLHTNKIVSFIEELTEKYILVMKFSKIAKEQHAAARIRFTRRRIIALGMNNLFEADLCEMTLIRNTNVYFNHDRDIFKICMGCTCEEHDWKTSHCYNENHFRIKNTKTTPHQQ
ncbi:hypothetical protein PR048_005237 [Dryococelus australis]|uniref:Uncharacterized protein n=1 Tax=Dryococelus australis TaxID=614101 RepID=A0ABQ9I8I4_9NEOP|nr:hypothetical protein PR048_005237 [Dryococelus australis]